MTSLPKERYVGALLGAAIGDALGWPKEQNSNKIKKSEKVNENFTNWTRKCGGRYWPHEEMIYAGEYSDDTQLLIATLRSLLKKQQWGTYFRKVELPAWLTYERGGGGATKRAARSWEKDRSPWDISYNSEKEIRSYFMAGGNGVAMRILPHVFGNEDDTITIIKQVVLNGMYTHGHPRALIGAMLYACGLQYLFNVRDTLKYGQLIDYLIENQDLWNSLPKVSNIEAWLKCSKEVVQIDYLKLWDEVIIETVNYLRIAKEGLKQGVLDIGNETLEKLGCFNKKINGAGNITTVASFYLFSKYASSPKTGVIEAANLANADTDTLASMTGGLLGALHGEDWIPLEWRILQDYDMFHVLVNKLINEDDDLILKGMDYKLFNKNALTTFKTGGSQVLLPFGNIKLIEVRNEKVYSDLMYAETHIFKTDYGQTLFAKKMGKCKRVIDKEYIEMRDNSLVNYSKNLVILNKIKQLSKVFYQVDKTKDFLALIFFLAAEKDKSNIDMKDFVDNVKDMYSKYNLTKEQIVEAYEILDL